MTPPVKRLVVVLEEEPLAAHALGLLLADWGFECLHGRAVADVLPQLAERANDVTAVISNDRLAQGATGLEAMRLMESWGIAAPGLLLTAGFGRLRAGGAVGYWAMEKPVAPEALRAWLEARPASGRF